MELFKSKEMPCFEVPEKATRVLVTASGTGEGFWVRFDTPAGWMYLARKSDYRNPLEFMSIDTILKRVRHEGWTASIIIAEDAWA